MIAKFCIAAFLISSIALAQPPTKPAPSPKALAFDAVSIHPTPSGKETTIHGNVEVHFTTTHDLNDGFRGENISLKYLIVIAYNIKPDSLSGGPDWIDSSSYEINAKVFHPDDSTPPKLTKSQRNQMLQSLLADRFKLVVHTETKDAPIYELTLAKSGPKFHETTPGDTFASGVKGLDGQTHIGYPMMTALGQLTGQATPIGSIIDFLTQTLHRPIVDKTGLTGKYDIALQWTPDNTPADSPTAGGPSIFTAIQEQLGLKLESTKGPVETLVIDHIEKPSEN
ncbi:MAG: TIGR03435 family protein [Acidobacteriota bacterium]|nr:TIGR03435 family protein [Acidobacteriota bacterium]